MCLCLSLCVSYNPGFKGWFDFSLLQQDPVNLPEEGMSLDGLLTALAHHAAQAFGRVLGHELHIKTHTISTFNLKLYCLKTHPLFKTLCCGFIHKMTRTSRKHLSANNRAEVLMALRMVQTKRRSGRVMKQVSRVLVLFTVTESCASSLLLFVQYFKSTS